ncbi:MAG: PilZ domain-containing protein [Candidatus Omnitrophica bacterium]|jgi:c-di-GMP-binding flagellar brake protein YcgR|nr:PilZ domain-containing protein [Candidatus Omnitrophota bacterium]MDD5081649.1 PilZ domain-containing protein [Candidatus Omnitrophota bacterium]MDD5441371.1 PilZ domain-containing protein [Candidatus Omnitrophota bacterium]
MDHANAEKRRFIRANFPCKITINTPKKHLITTHTENIGAGGVRVLVEEEMAISSLVELEVSLPKQAIACKGRVVWNIKKNSSYAEQISLFDVGVEFFEINQIDKDIVDAFVKSIVVK